MCLIKGVFVGEKNLNVILIYICAEISKFVCLVYIEIWAQKVQGKEALCFLTMGHSDTIGSATSLYKT